MPNDEATTPPGDDDLPPALASSVFGSPAVDRSPPYLDARRGSLGDLVSVGEACAVGTRWEQWRRIYPCALSSFPNGLSSALQGKRVVLFSDYDGTLAPIVRDPDQAHMSEPMRRVLNLVSRLFPTAIVSGRARHKVEAFVQLDHLMYAGSHGLDIAAPTIGNNGAKAARMLSHTPAQHFAPVMDAVFEGLRQRVSSVPGAAVEHNQFSVSVHFRNCAEEAFPAVLAIVEQELRQHKHLRLSRGRKVIEVRPELDWDKGRALLYLLRLMQLEDDPCVVPIYLGDDRTDEDAFRAVGERRGYGLLVSSVVKPTAAHFTLREPREVEQFLRMLAEWGMDGDRNPWLTGEGLLASMARGQEVTAATADLVQGHAPRGVPRAVSHSGSVAASIGGGSTTDGWLDGTGAAWGLSAAAGPSLHGSMGSLGLAAHADREGQAGAGPGSFGATWSGPVESTTEGSLWRQGSLGNGAQNGAGAQAAGAAPEASVGMGSQEGGPESASSSSDLVVLWRPGSSESIAALAECVRQDAAAALKAPPATDTPGSPTSHASAGAGYGAIPGSPQPQVAQSPGFLQGLAASDRLGVPAPLRAEGYGVGPSTSRHRLAMASARRSADWGARPVSDKAQTVGAEEAGTPGVLGSATSSLWGSDAAGTAEGSEEGAGRRRQSAWAAGKGGGPGGTGSAGGSGDGGDDEDGLARSASDTAGLEMSRGVSGAGQRGVSVGLRNTPRRAPGPVV